MTWSNISSEVGSILCKWSLLFTLLLVAFVVVVASVGVANRGTVFCLHPEVESACMVHKSPRPRIHTPCPSDTEQRVTSLKLHLPRTPRNVASLPQPTVFITHCVHWWRGWGGVRGWRSHVLVFPELALTDLSCSQLSLKDAFPTTPLKSQIKNL